MPLDASALHRLIESCLRDRMKAKPYAVDMSSIRRCLGLEPLPPRTDLLVERGESLPCGTFERRLYSFAAKPEVRVPVTAYVPSNSGPHPLLVVAPDKWVDGRRAPWVQAMGISLAMQGVLVVAIDPPGVADRSGMGDGSDVTLAASAPALGEYVWDLVRTVDFAVAELGALGEQVATLGVGCGGSAALLQGAIDSRVHALVIGGAGHSQEQVIDESYREMPGIADVGDWSNLIAHRAEMPILFLVGEDDAPERVDLTAKKLRSVYGKASQSKVRVDRFLGNRDLNRRMRESAAAFLLTHLAGATPKAYVPEPLPMTDGLVNPAPANTEAPDQLSCPVIGRTFVELRDSALVAPYPERTVELIPWGKYGRLEPLAEVESLKIVDFGESPNVLALPRVDAQMLVPLGLSVADFYAQMLHLLLPGGPEGWEPLGLQGDALTAMIASVRTLMKGAETKHPPKRIEAEGAVSSLSVRLLGLMRPGLETTVTHSASGWHEIMGQGILVPGARYRKWPFVSIPSEPAPGLTDTLGEIPASTRAEGFSGDEPISDETNSGEDRQGHDECDQ